TPAQFFREEFLDGDDWTQRDVEKSQTPLVRLFKNALLKNAY
nr:53K protein - chicken (fragments) [Gallus gallus]